jgi:hypothetical protein
MGRSAALVALLAVALFGCTGHVNKVTMDTARLGVPAAYAKRIPLGCAYRLLDVVDARSSGDRAGGLGWHMFVFDDAASVVRSQLSTAGLGAAEGEGEGTAVTVRIVQLYLGQSNGTKIPVAVYDVDVAGQPRFLVRSQQATMIWNGSENEAYAAYSRALADANQKLVLRLNASCAANG